MNIFKEIKAVCVCVCSHVCSWEIVAIVIWLLGQRENLKSKRGRGCYYKPTVKLRIAVTYTASIWAKWVMGKTRTSKVCMYVYVEGKLGRNKNSAAVPQAPNSCLSGRSVIWSSQALFPWGLWCSNTWKEVCSLYSCVQDGQMLYWRNEEILDLNCPHFDLSPLLLFVPCRMCSVAGIQSSLSLGWSKAWKTTCRVIKMQG